MSLAQIREALETELIAVGDASITGASIIASIAVVLLTLLFARVLERAAIRTLRMARVEDQGTLGVAGRVVHYVVMVIGLGLAINALGINLTSLFAAGAVLAVAVGFAAQNVLQNFFSGLILLSEGAIKPGDILEVEGRVVRVTRMGIRATVARTRDEEELILPNALLAQATVKNYTLNDSVYRLRTVVGVTYGSDMKLVKETLYAAAAALPFGRDDHDPVVLMAEFGDSSVVFDVSVWVDNPWGTLTLRSELNEAIWWALKDAGITIAFPQMDVHLDDSVIERLATKRDR